MMIRAFLGACFNNQRVHVTARVSARVRVSMTQFLPIAIKSVQYYPRQSLWTHIISIVCVCRKPSIARASEFLLELSRTRNVPSGRFSRKLPACSLLKKKKRKHCMKRRERKIENNQVGDQNWYRKMVKLMGKKKLVPLVVLYLMPFRDHASLTQLIRNSLNLLKLADWCFLGDRP